MEVGWSDGKLEGKVGMAPRKRSRVKTDDVERGSCALRSWERKDVENQVEECCTTVPANQRVIFLRRLHISFRKDKLG